MPYGYKKSIKKTGSKNTVPQSQKSAAEGKNMMGMRQTYKQTGKVGGIGSSVSKKKAGNPHNYGGGY